VAAAVETDPKDVGGRGRLLPLACWNSWNETLNPKNQDEENGESEQ